LVNIGLCGTTSNFNMLVELTGSTYIAVLLAFLSVLTTLLGVTLAIYIGKNERAIATGIGFSAGIMLLISFFELIPEAIDDTNVAITSIACISGVLIVAVLHWLIPHSHLIEEKGAFNRAALKTAYLVTFGLILHDVPEGFAMANSYIASPSMGILVALAIAIHNIPEEFAIGKPLVSIVTIFRLTRPHTLLRHPVIRW